MKNLPVLLFLFFAGVAIRTPFLEKMQSHWDGPQYSIGVIRYSLAQQTPAIPGYPLYIYTAKAIYPFVNDPHIAILLVSVLFSGLGAVIFYLAGKILFNSTTGLITSILFLSGTAFYFFGITAYPYIAIPVISASLAVVIFLIAFKKKPYGIFLGLIFSFAVGFRPQETPFILPLFLFGFYYLSIKQKVLTVVSFLLILILWLIPFIQMVGGINNYFLEFQRFINAGAFPPFSIYNIQRWTYTVIQGLYFSFGIGVVFLSVVVFQNYRKLFPNKILAAILRKEFIFFFIWITPSLVFNIFIRSDHAGYQGTYLSALLVLIAYGIWLATKRRELLRYFTLFVIVFINLFIFFYDRDPNNEMPYRQSSFHFSEIRKNDLRLSSKVNYITKNFSPKSTLLITEPFQWRQLMYHLSDYQTFEMDGLFTENEKYKYIMRQSRNLNFIESKNKSFIFTVPKGINKIIFTDENMFLKVKDNKKVIYLPGNSNMTVISVIEDEKYKYNLETFEKI